MDVHWVLFVLSSYSLLDHQETVVQLGAVLEKSVDLVIVFQLFSGIFEVFHFFFREALDVFVPVLNELVMEDSRVGELIKVVLLEDV